MRGCGRSVDAAELSGMDRELFFQLVEVVQKRSGCLPKLGELSDGYCPEMHASSLEDVYRMAL
jgi:hypothetical protein